MNKFKFVYNGRDYELGGSNCSYVANDEEHPVSGIDRETVIDLLKQGADVGFAAEYYDQPCGGCLAGKEKKAKYFKFLEYHFFIYTKKGRYIISGISREYEGKALGRLLREGTVDNSYVVSIAVCPECGDYSIEIEQCDV